jgi:hypothetical protein
MNATKQGALNEIAKLYAIVEQVQDSVVHEQILIGTGRLISTLMDRVPCANPKCGRAARNRGRFCSNRCANAVRAQRHRQKERASRLQ